MADLQITDPVLLARILNLGENKQYAAMYQLIADSIKSGAIAVPCGLKARVIACRISPRANAAPWLRGRSSVPLAYGLTRIGYPADWQKRVHTSRYVQALLGQARQHPGSLESPRKQRQIRVNGGVLNTA